MKARDIGPVRLVAFFLALTGSLFVLRAFHFGKVDVTVGKGTYVAITQSNDPVLFWVIVVLVSLLTAALFYCAFGKAENRRR
jgi:hypothetical protein